jgi:hypothetical protein
MEHVLGDAFTRGHSGDRWISRVQLGSADGRTEAVAARIFIDASYEGDLIAAAQIAYRIGMEGTDEYGESAAPDESNGHLQGYNFRLTMTREPSNRVPLRPPEGYDRDCFVGILPLFESGRLKRVFGTFGDDEAVVKAQIPILPNGKSDINDAGPVKLSMPGEQLLWPEGDADTRRRIYHRHVLWNVGLLYFLQHDRSVPLHLREEALQWGFCRDEFEETGHLPPQLYVREARRMTGLRVFTQHDTRHAEGDARAVLHRDAIAMGDYGHSTHGTWHEGSRFGGTRHGFRHRVVHAPYQIPYGTLLPKDVRNLLAPVPASASHVGFCALRLEPIWSSLGQAAGHAAHLALEADGTPDVRTVNVPRLQRRLHADRSATVYFSDIGPDSPDFGVAQWWGTLGGFHGLHPRPSGSLLGPTIEGQHSEAWLNHRADLDVPLDPALARRWIALARDAGIDASPPAVDERLTRGEWLRRVFALVPSP